jgi:hypothetical protein
MEDKCWEFIKKWQSQSNLFGGFSLERNIYEVHATYLQATAGLELLDHCLFSLNSFSLIDGQSSCRFRSKKRSRALVQD